MYFVDRKQIEELLIYIDGLLEDISNNEFTSELEKLALERIAHVLIESILDVGNLMIDGFIMRDPGSYDDIIDILTDEKVIPEEEEAVYKDVIGLRKNLVTDFMYVDHHQLEIKLKEYVSTLTKFSTHTRTYLTNELGVANAFLPE